MTVQPVNIDGTMYLSLKDAAEELNQNEHYVRSLCNKFEVESLAAAGQKATGVAVTIVPGGIPSIKRTEGNTVRRYIPVDAITAYKAKSAGGARATADGKKLWKIRFSAAQLDALKAGTLSADDQKEAAASLTVGNNYDPVKSKQRRLNKNKAAAASADDEETGETEPDDESAEPAKA